MAAQEVTCDPQCSSAWSMSTIAGIFTQSLLDLRLGGRLASRGVTLYAFAHYRRSHERGQGLSGTTLTAIQGTPFLLPPGAPENAMDQMNKRERVQAALQGKPVDRPPISFWRH